MSVGHCFVCESVFLNKSGKRDMVFNLTSKIEVKQPSVFPNIRFLGEDQHCPEAEKYLKDRCPQLYSDFDFHKYGFYTLGDKVIIKFLKDTKDYFYQILSLHFHFLQ